jgi:hypothetical protein
MSSFSELLLRLLLKAGLESLAATQRATPI